MRLVESAIKANEYQKQRMVEKIEKSLGDPRNRNICILGLAFKPETDDMREAPSIPIIRRLIDKGCSLKLYDPAAMENARRHVFTGIDEGRILYCENEYQAAEDVDVLVILTEWNQFRRLDLPKIRGLMKGRHFFDFRNLYEPEDMIKFGFIYEGVGR